MIISALGGFAAKVGVGDVTWVINPSPKQTKVSSDAVIATSMAPDVHAVGQASHGESEPFVIDGPGSYECNSIQINAVMAATSELGDHISTVYRFTMDDMSVVVLGPGVQKKEGLEPAVTEQLGESDILFVAITPDTKISELAALIVMAGPRIIIPLGVKPNDSAVTTLAKELSKTLPDAVDKITLKKRDLDGKQQDIMLLQV